MRKRAVFVLLLLSCFPDADKLRTKGGGGPGPITSGSGGGISIGGAGGSLGGAGGAGGTPSANRAQLCNELAIASAAKAHECSPFIQAFRFGSQAAHATRIRLNCNIYDLPSVQFPPSPFKPCAEALAAQSCSDWIDSAPLPACQGSGALPLGTTCASGFQCQTDLCDLPDTGCGKCATLSGEGQACYKGFCADGLVCNMAGTCVKAAHTGAACDGNNPCAESLVCHLGRCAARGLPGAACDGDDDCDIYHGSICPSTATSPDMVKRCVTATVGPRCTINPDGSYVLCGGTSRCRMGTCVPPADDGATCAMDGPDCLWPAQCLSDNQCHLFQPNRACLGMAAVRPTEPGLELPPPEIGVGAFWRSLVPRPPKQNF